MYTTTSSTMYRYIRDAVSQRSRRDTETAVLSPSVLHRCVCVCDRKNRMPIFEDPACVARILDPQTVSLYGARVFFFSSPVRFSFFRIIFRPLFRVFSERRRSSTAASRRRSNSDISREVFPPAAGSRPTACRNAACSVGVRFPNRRFPVRRRRDDSRGRTTEDGEKKTKNRNGAQYALGPAAVAARDVRVGQVAGGRGASHLLHVQPAAADTSRWCTRTRFVMCAHTHTRTRAHTHTRAHAHAHGWSPRAGWR